MPRAYVRSPATGEVYEFSGYVRGLTAQEFSFVGPAPLRLVVKFPRPTVRIVEKRTESERQMAITKTLMELPVQQAIVRTATGALAHLKVVDVTLPVRMSDLSVYLASGQDSEEIEETYQWRRAMIEAIAAPILPNSVPTHIHLGRLLPEEPEAALDGSL
jgi:hypothetical protein